MNELVVNPQEKELQRVANTIRPILGDAAFEGWYNESSVKIGVERKAGPDLVRSWTSGHLADQLRRMADEYDLVILLVEGPPLETNNKRYIFDGRRVRKLSFHGLMNDLQTWQDNGLRITWCGKGGAAYRLKALHSYYQRPEHEATRQPQLKRTKGGLLSVPGLGPKRVEALVRRLMAAAPDDLDKLVTPKVAAELRRRMDDAPV